MENDVGLTSQIDMQSCSRGLWVQWGNFFRLFILQEEIKTVFSNYFRTINPKTLVMLDEKIGLFKDYLHLSKQESVRLFVKHHFLIPASTDKIRQTIILLMSLRRNVPSIDRDRIIKLLDEYPQVFLLGRHQILDLVKIFKSW